MSGGKSLSPSFPSLLSNAMRTKARGVAAAAAATFQALFSERQDGKRVLEDDGKSAQWTGRGREAGRTAAKNS